VSDRQRREADGTVTRLSTDAPLFDWLPLVPGLTYVRHAVELPERAPPSMTAFYLTERSLDDILADYLALLAGWDIRTSGVMKTGNDRPAFYLRAALGTRVVTLSASDDEHRVLMIGCHEDGSVTFD
jgi:hypothetical protein